MVTTDRLDAQSRNRDIWMYDLVRGTEQRLTFAGDNWFPVWSPDSLRVAYVNRTETKVIVKAADGTGPEEVLEAAAKGPMDLDPGRQFSPLDDAGLESENRK